MKAIFKNKPKENTILTNRKEDKIIHGYKVILSDFSEAIDLRIYGTNAKNYACIWINHADLHVSGGGNAGGYGYHRPSAAVSCAIRNAGIELSQSISGVGDSAIRQALEAITKAITRKKFKIVEFYG